MMRKYHEAKISPPKLNEKAHNNKNDISIWRASNNKCHWNCLFFIRSVYAYDSYGFVHISGFMNENIFHLISNFFSFWCDILLKI